MPQIDQHTELHYTKKKRTVIIAAFVFSVAISPFGIISVKLPFPFRIGNLIYWFAVSVLVFSWCYFDSLQRNRTVTTGLRLLIVFLGIFGLCIYLINSRGLKQGLISSAKALGLVAGMLLVTFICGFLVAVALDFVVPDV